MFVTRECQTDSSHFTAEEMLDSWQQRHQLKQLFHTSCSCFWKPGSVNYNRHTLFTSALWQERGEKEHLCECFTKIGWHYWDLLRKIRASHDYIPSPFHLRIGYYGDDLPQSLSSDHYFLSGLVSANCRPAHSVQPNWPNQMLGLRSDLPRHFLTANRIPVIVWALCLHSGISCTLNHRHG